ncbi:histone-lysine N-trimethyltransferase SMYD5-like [Physella acuta]|uniref:histone-lysine N-trimethyltransferase SMYD5-like n=1 Tax=Physella acuta TaxID=109671 RepID=UPI0027DB8661|nr:histone-lysine N-trimethyltransferase SMYD5-like [Physella acuta]
MAAHVFNNVRVIHMSDSKGRGLVSCNSFQKGDTLFEEKPLVCAQFSWNELYKYLACEYCLRSLESAEDMVKRLTTNPSLTLPHPECCQVDPSKYAACPQCKKMYCSVACRDQAASQYHQVLCKGASEDDPNHPLNRLVEDWRSFHYPPETTSIMLIVKMIAMVKQAQDKGKVISLFSNFVNTTSNEQEHIAHKLLGEKFQVQREVLRQQLAEIMFDDSIAEWFTSEGFNSLLALIGTNGQGIGSSSFSHWVKNTENLSLAEEDKKSLDEFIEKVYEQLDEVSGEFLDCEGSGLYHLQSSCNHSCVPNAEITFPNGDHTLVMVALRDIAPEEEITISYLGCCDLERSRHSRQKVLKENYLFKCACEKCQLQADDASVTSEEDLSDEQGDDMED